MRTNDVDAKSERQLELLRQFAEVRPTELIPILDLIPIGICITDSYGIFIEVNQAYCDFYRYSREELIGNSFTMVVPEDYRLQMQQLHNEFMGKRYELQGKWEVVDKYGNVRKILSSAAYIPASPAQDACKMTFVIEVDQGDQVLQGLQDTVDLLKKKISAQEVAQQLSNHDIRNNLASILQMVEVLLEKQPTQEQQLWLKHLKERSTHTLDMLKTSFDYAKMEQGSYQIKSEEFDLIQVIKNEFEALQRLIKVNSIEMTLSYRDRDVSKEEVFVEADKFYMQQLFHNLLLNAVEASSPHQTISIALDQNRFFKITIHNDGVIPREIREKFFDKFVSSGKDRGTGLGTYLAKLVVEMHHGTIAFQSLEGEGTDIIILLPRSILLN